MKIVVGEDRMSLWVCGVVELLDIPQVRQVCLFRRSLFGGLVFDRCHKYCQFKRRVKERRRMNVIVVVG